MNGKITTYIRRESFCIGITISSIIKMSIGDVELNKPQHAVVERKYPYRQNKNSKEAVSWLML